MPLPPRPPPRPGRGLTRAAFRPPPDFDVLTSLWVAESAHAPGVRLTLLYDYPDFTPEVGWKVDYKGATYAVTAVDGRALDCEVAP